MDFLFAEEAESFWSRQDSIWKEEQKARERLIGDVVDSWRNQVEFNMKGISSV